VLKIQYNLYTYFKIIFYKFNIILTLILTPLFLTILKRRRMNAKKKNMLLVSCYLEQHHVLYTNTLQVTVTCKF